MKTVFFSYSHRDQVLRDQLEIHLSMLKRNGEISAWHDHMIPAGAGFDDAISEKLNEADVILLLLSPDFLASDYCYNIEKSRALERHRAGTAQVIPIILRPCDGCGKVYDFFKHQTRFRRVMESSSIDGCGKAQ